MYPPLLLLLLLLLISLQAGHMSRARHPLIYKQQSAKPNTCHLLAHGSIMLIDKVVVRFAGRLPCLDYLDKGLLHDTLLAIGQQHTPRDC